MGAEPAPETKRDSSRAASSNQVGRVGRAAAADRLKVQSILSVRRLQRAIPVGAPGDAYEREADAVADAVMKAPAETSPREDEEELEKRVPEPRKEEQIRTLRRQAGDEATDVTPAEASVPTDVSAPPAASAGDEEPETWPEPSEEELEAMGNVQMKPVPGPVHEEGDPSSGSLARRVAEPSGGRPLPADVRSVAETRLGYDFSSVRVHDQPQDHADARALGARAFTYGPDIWLGKDERPSDLRLMVHELTHVVQQGSAVPRSGFPAGGSTTPVLAGAPRQIQGGWFPDPREKIREFAVSYARRIPGYTLLTVILGRDPVTGQTVERNANNFARGVLEFVPGGERIYENLVASGALQRAVEWMERQLQLLDLTWTAIVDLVSRAVDSLKVSDILDPGGAWERVRGFFEGPVNRLLTFAKNVGRAILEFVLEAVMTRFGPLGHRVLGVIRRAGEVFGMIVADPIGFVSNLVSAIGQGLNQFSSKILDYLKSALFKWLFGALSSAGITLPDKFDFRGILSIVLQFLGITYQKVRGMLVKALGERRVAILEKVFGFLGTLVSEGPAAAWKQIVEWIENLRDQVIEGIRNWVATSIVGAAIKKLLLMFNPAGALIQAIIAIYDTIKFFVEKIEEIADFANAVFESIANIAAGRLQQAANFIEGALARVLPLMIDFLARWAGLGGLSGHIKKIIGGVHKRVDSALTRLINWMVQWVRSVLARVRTAAGTAVAAVTQWWKSRIKFRAGEEEHDLFFEGDEENAQVMVASTTPKEVGDWLKANEPSESDKAGDLARIYGEAHLRYGQVKTALSEARAAVKATKKKGASKEEKNSAANLKNKLTDLRISLADLMQRLRQPKGPEDKWKMPKTKVEYGATRTVDLGNDKKDEYGTWAEANPLTIHGEKGSSPSKLTTAWDVLRHRREGGRTFYVLGHLLNEQLHGPGNTAQNLTPISQKANKDHLTEVEEHVKDWVWNREIKDDKSKDSEKKRANLEGQAVRYKVEAHYKSHPVTLSDMEGKIDKTRHPNAIKKRMREIVTAEQTLARRITCDAVPLKPKPDGSGLEEDKDGKILPKRIEIENRIPDTVSDLAEES